MIFLLALLSLSEAVRCPTLKTERTGDLQGCVDLCLTVPARKFEGKNKFEICDTILNPNIQTQSRITQYTNKVRIRLNSESGSGATRSTQAACTLTSTARTPPNRM